jgi:hypothetical protein
MAGVSGGFVSEVGVFGAMVCLLLAGVISMSRYTIAWYDIVVKLNL